MNGNDRDWLTKFYLPRLGGRILYIGVNDYTSEYHKLVEENSRFESLDVCGERSKHGQSSYRHYNLDLKDFHDEEGFDHVSMHGIHGFIGHEIKNDKIEEDIRKADGLVRQGGTLQVGPTCTRLSDLDESFWHDFFRDNDTFVSYDTLWEGTVGWGNGSPDSNYIWWGKKKN